MLEWIKTKAVQAYDAAASAVAFVAQGLKALCDRVVEAVKNVISGAGSVADWAITGIAGGLIGGLLYAAAVAIAAMTVAALVVSALTTGSAYLDLLVLMAAGAGVLGAGYVFMFTGIKTGDWGVAFKAMTAYVLNAPRILLEWLTTAAGVLVTALCVTIMVVTGAPLVEVIGVPLVAAFLGLQIDMCVNYTCLLNAVSIELAAAPQRGINGEMCAAGNRAGQDSYTDVTPLNAAAMAAA